MAVTIEVVGAKELIAKLTTLEQLQKVKKTIYDEAVYLKDKLATYPTNAHGPNTGLRGDSEKAKKMRRGFFYHLKQGTISVPYTRTGILGTRWTVTSDSTGWVATVANSMFAYNSLVQGPDQTIGHSKSGWLTVDKAKENEEAGVIARIEAALEEEVADVG